jgi:hypothetical protein
MEVLVLQNLVTLLLVAIHPLFLVMTMTHVLMMSVTQNLDALTHQLNVTITINVLMILATHNTDVHTNATNVNSKMPAIL